MVAAQDSAVRSREVIINVIYTGSQIDQCHVVELTVPSPAFTKCVYILDGVYSPDQGIVSRSRVSNSASSGLKKYDSRSWHPHFDA